MSAVAAVRAPLFQEAGAYWDDLIENCRRLSQAINTVVAQKGWSREHFVACLPGPSDRELRIVKFQYPSTDMHLTINYYSWGPMIDLLINGEEDEDLEFRSEEFTLPVGADGDGSVVAIYDEGRSFSARELALYLMQRFRRCFPGITLPC